MYVFYSKYINNNNNNNSDNNIQLWPS
jgi:hypothetical protein